MRGHKKEINISFISTHKRNSVQIHQKEMDVGRGMRKKIRWNKIEEKSTL